MILKKKKLITLALTVCLLIASLVGTITAIASQTNWLSVSYSNKQCETLVGQSVELPTVSPVYPDKVDRIYFSVESPTGKPVENDGVTFLAEEQGDYTVFVCVIGKDGNSYVESYSVTAIKSDKPVLSVKPAIPMAFLEGSEYTVPTATFIDYNTEVPTEVEYSVYLIDEFGSETLLSQNIIPTVSLHGAKIGLKYVATSLATAQTETV